MRVLNDAGIIAHLRFLVHFARHAMTLMLTGLVNTDAVFADKEYDGCYTLLSTVLIYHADIMCCAARILSPRHEYVLRGIHE